jgi:hypothetical protein
MRKDVTLTFALNWLEQRHKLKKTTKGERKLVMEFAKVIDKMMEVSINEKN